MPPLVHRLFFRPVDASSLAVFRIVFGALMLFEAVNYGGFLCLDCMYRDTDFLFKYHHFEWARMLPGRGLEIVFVVMGLAATGVMLGLFYRLSSVLLLVTFSYLFLLDQALYLNHFYLAIIFCAILVFVPAHRHWSLDARRRPGFASATVPNWGRLWLGAQLEIVLIYAGLVKLNADWLNLEPMRLWMTNQSADEAAIFQWLTQDWGIAAASYGSIVLHLIGAPLLLWKRTRLTVFCVYAVFHTINAFVFNIGIFPWMTLGATLLLFDPDWPRQVLRWLDARGVRWAQTPRVRALAAPVHAPSGRLVHASAERPVSRPLVAARAAGVAGATDAVLATVAAAPTGGAGVVRGAGAGGVVSAGAHGSPSRSSAFASPSWRYSPFAGAAIVTLVSLWLIAQTVVPLRHYVAPGHVAWNEAGHRFSWRMKLRSKRGQAIFYVSRDDGQHTVVDPADHLTRKQTRKMTCIPDLLWQFAQHLEEVHSEGGRHEVAVHVDTRCSLNTREPAPLVHRLVDLTEVRRDGTDWITPLSKSLPNPIF